MLTAKHCRQAMAARIPSYPVTLGADETRHREKNLSLTQISTEARATQPMRSMIHATTLPASLTSVSHQLAWESEQLVPETRDSHCVTTAIQTSLICAKAELMDQESRVCHGSPSCRCFPASNLHILESTGFTQRHRRTAALNTLDVSEGNPITPDVGQLCKHRSCYQV